MGTIVVFRIGAADAEFLETEFEPTFTPNDMVNLPKYQIVLKLMINGVASEPFSAITLPPNPEFQTENMDKVVKVSRERYANPVAEVEDKISRWMGAEFHQESALLIGNSEAALEQPAEPADIAINPNIPLIKVDAPELEAKQISTETPVPNQNAASYHSGDFVPASNAQPIEPHPETIPIAPEPPIHPNPQPAKPQPQMKGQAPLRNAEHQPSPTRHDNFQQGRERVALKHNQRRDHNHNRDHRHNNHTRHPKQAERKENPIWETVHSLQREKQKQEHPQINHEQFREHPGRPSKPLSISGSAPDKTFTDNAAATGKSSPTESRPSPPPAANHPGKESSRTVLKPNQSYKLN